MVDIRVLVAEDDRDLAEFARTVLSRRPGVHVQVATDGREALAAVERGGVDVLFPTSRCPG